MSSQHQCFIADTRTFLASIFHMCISSIYLSLFRLKSTICGIERERETQRRKWKKNPMTLTTVHTRYIVLYLLTMFILPFGVGWVDCVYAIFSLAFEMVNIFEIIRKLKHFFLFVYNSYTRYAFTGDEWFHTIPIWHTHSHAHTFGWNVL